MADEKLNEIYGVHIASPEEIWNDALNDYASLIQAGLKSQFFGRVMCFLEKHNPDNLMREDFRMNCERIYNDIPELDINYTYYELYNSKEMQDILESRNNLYSKDED